jgi:hypothetical protein
VTLALVLAGCAKFESPDVVVDLRVLAMSADRPLQIVDVDLTQPLRPADLLAQLQPVTVCALVADPGLDRRLRYALTMCPYGSEGRCDGDVNVPLGAGLIDDPDTTPAEPQLCATIAPNGNLLGVLLDALDGDELGGLGGVDYMVQLTIGGEDADPSLDQYAAKTLEVAPRIPATRSPNQNPTLARIEATMADNDALSVLGGGRCIDAAPLLAVAPHTAVRLTPIEPPDARETYSVPTLDGTSRTFTESLTYQWVASAGGFSSDATGGPHDLAGNAAPLFTDWTSPSAKDLTGPTNVSLWIVQRDERLGSTWYESCIRVVP